MRILILSCNTGEGHNSAGMAICEELLRRGHFCEMKNALELLSPSFAQIISKGHVYVYRHLPWLFGLGYKFEEQHPVKMIKTECEKAADDMWKMLSSGEYDVVVCVHVFPALTLTEVIRRYHPSFKTYFVATDYTCSPGVSDIHLDKYVIPHADLCEEFVSAGVPLERILPVGIPVKSMFYRNISKESAKEQLGLPTDKKVVLLSCGSMGCGPIEDLALSLKRQLSENAMLVAICGSNKMLYDVLHPEEVEGRLSVVGFTKQMPLYMSAADLYLTKAGGLSTTEALVKRLPLIYINAVPGCESHNMNFCCSHGVASSARRVRGLVKLTCSFVKDEERQKRMIAQIEKVMPNCAVEDLCDDILKKK